MCKYIYIAWKVSKYGFFSGPYSLVFGFTPKISVFSPNTGKYGLEKTPYLDTFHTVRLLKILIEAESQEMQRWSEKCDYGED